MTSFILKLVNGLAHLQFSFARLYLVFKLGGKIRLPFLASMFVACSAYSMEPVEAVRLLQQGTFGPTPTEVSRLKTMTAEQWVDAQLALPVTLHRSYFPENFDYMRTTVRRNSGWFKAALNADDQLRQRMAFALSQIFVVSQVGTSNLHNHQIGFVNYYDTLVDGALGNYRDLMFNVTMHPVMGAYLTYSPNNKADVNGVKEADENYARELLQLMSVGLYLLNLDGSFKLDSNGQPIEAYTQQHIKSFAKVFTGLCKSGRCDPRFGDYDRPMSANHNEHDLTEKQLFSSVLPANPASVAVDIHAALNDVFLHPNVAPFVSKRLIQMLVTSNPSPAYIERVSKVFNNNGSGIKGDLAAVAKSILLDDEARNGHLSELANVFGKLREPLLTVTHVFRALEVNDVFSTPVKGFHFLAENFQQAPMMAPTVFNYYHFDYTHPTLLQKYNTGPQVNEPVSQLESASTLLPLPPALAGTTITSPVFEMLPEDKLLNRLNFVYANVTKRSEVFSAYGPLVNIIDNATSRAEGIDALVDHLDLMFTQGLMSNALRTQIKYIINTTRAFDTNRNGTRKNRYLDANAIGDVMMMLFTSPEFIIQR